MFKKRSKVLFFAAGLGALYLILVIVYFWMRLYHPNNSQFIGIGHLEANGLALAHILFAGLGDIFLLVGFLVRRPWMALIGAFSATLGFFALSLGQDGGFWGVFNWPLIALGFIGFYNQKMINKMQ